MVARFTATRQSGKLLVWADNTRKRFYSSSAASAATTTKRRTRITRRKSSAPIVGGKRRPPHQWNKHGGIRLAPSPTRQHQQRYKQRAEIYATKNVPRIIGIALGQNHIRAHCLGWR